MTTGRRIATLGLAAGFCLLTAQDMRETVRNKGPLPATLEAYGDADKSCQEWTDGCATCMRRANGTSGCSLPGIACQPSTVACSEKSEPAKAAPQ